MPPPLAQRVPCILCRHYSTALRTPRQLARASKAQTKAAVRTPRSPARPLRNTLKAGTTVGKTDDFIANYLEDEEPNHKRRRVNPRVAEGAEKELQDELNELDEAFDESSLDEEMPDSFAKLVMSKEQRQVGQKAVEDELNRLIQNALASRGLGETDAGMLSIGDIQLMPWQVASTRVIPKQYQILLKKLNDALDSARDDIKNPKSRQAVLTWYSHCKHNLRDFLNMIPNPGWKLLWNLVSYESATNPSRASHRKKMADDMLAAGLQLTTEQQLGQIEGIFMEGNEDEALRQWKVLEDANRPDALHLEIGVRMFARKGDLEQAEATMDRLFSARPTYDPRIVLVVIKAHLHLKTANATVQVWKLYGQLRDRLSTDMTLNDYDQIILALLNSGRSEQALAVYRDMMMSTEPKDEVFFNRASARMRQIMANSTEVKPLADASLSALTHLPRKYQNKYFYASWLKRLIGMGETEAAAQVIDLMYERKVSPDAKHVNGLISAWLREDDPDTIRKAELMAWGMVQARLESVSLRDSTSVQSVEDASAQAAKAIYRNESLSIPKLVQRPTPPATIETFCILARHYVLTDRDDHLRHLRDLLSEAKIIMNAPFLNTILHSVLRSGTPRDVWNRYLVLSRDIMPDIETFGFLWECMKYQLDPTFQPGTPKNDFRNPTLLFRMMVDWFDALPRQARNDAIADFDRAYYDNLVRCFCLTENLAGSFIAMQVMKERFNIYPNPITAKMLVLQIARRNMPRRTVNQRFSIPKSPQYKTQLAKTFAALEQLTETRRSELQERNITLADLDDVQRSEEHHRLMLELVFAVLHSSLGGVEAVQAQLEQAADRMGVERYDLDVIMAPVV